MKKLVFILLALMSFNVKGQSLEWALGFGGSSASYEGGKKILIDDNNNIYVGGHFRETINLNPMGVAFNLTSNGGEDIYIAKYNPNGFLVWGFKLGNSNSSTNFDELNDMVFDNNGNIIITGGYYNSVDFDSGVGANVLTSNGSKDIFVAKYDSDGNHIWAFGIGGSGSANDAGEGLVVDASNNILVTGGFRGTNVDFDPSGGVSLLSSNGSYTDIFIAKYSENGTLIWVKKIGGTESSTGLVVDIDDDNNIYCAGNYGGSMDFDPGAGVSIMTSAGNKDFFLIKFDNNGDFTWSKNIGGPNPESKLWCLKIDNLGNILLTGNFSNNCDFDPGPGLATLAGASTDTWGFLAKYNSDGDYVFAHRYGSASTASICLSQVICDDFNNYYIYFGANAGTFTNINPSGTSMNLSNNGRWIANYTDNMTLLNHFLVCPSAGTNVGKMGGISLDNSGNIVSIGYFYGTIDFDPSPLVYNVSSTGGPNSFISKIHLCTAPVINTQPVPKSTCHLTSTTFTINASNVLYYQWQSSTDGVSYSNITDGATYSGTTTATLTVNADNSLNGRYYRCVLTGNCPPDVNSNGAVLTVFQLPNVSAGNDFTACPNQSITLSGSGASSYTWNNSVVNNSPFSISQTNTYTVTGTDVNNCQNTDDVTITVLAPPMQEVCVVTVDELLADHNIIFWEKPANLGNIDSFYVYREITFNNYQIIGAKHVSEISDFSDYGANPNSTSYKYKITVLDTCGNESDFGLYHKSIHLQYSGLGNFQWTFYEIENTPNQVASYNFWRDDAGNGSNWQILQTVSGSSSSFTDVDYASYPNAIYRVDLNWISGNECTSTKANINTSRSNTKGVAAPVDGIQDALAGLITLVPNPTNGAIRITLPDVLLGQSIVLTNAVGQILQTTTITSTSVEYDLSNLADGIYFVQVQTHSGMITKKIVKN